MSLISESQQRAAKIASIHQTTIGFLRAQAQESYDLLANAPDPQAVLNSFGVNGNGAAAALNAYAALYNLLVTLGAAEGVPFPDFQTFSPQPQPNGTVLYNPPQPS
jgi:hypothetical protein